MKKVIPAFVMFLMLLLLCTYLFFPAQQTLTHSIRLHVPQKALQRVLLEQSMAQKQKSSANEGTTNSAQQITLLPDMFDGFILRVPYQNTTHNSLMRFIALRTDTTLVHWNAVVRGGNAPWQRIQTWRKSRRINTEVQKFLLQLRKLEQPEQIYGFAINRGRVKDTAFIATRFTSPNYPTTAAIYKQIALLEQYIKAQRAEAVGYPMLHVQATGSAFEAMVALPVNKLLPANGPFEPKRMIMGNILSAEIKGGTTKVESGMKQLQHYVTDHEHTSPAIPFLSLVTNRMEESDSTKWITKLYYPII
jgi:hypothetical protein